MTKTNIDEFFCPLPKSPTQTGFFVAKTQGKIS
jgi:hypothetical protein